jgi:hypothetical protein
MDYFENGSFIEQLDLQNQISKKSNTNTILVICLVVVSCSLVVVLVKMNQYKDVSIYYKGIGLKNNSGDIQNTLEENSE